MEKVFIPSTENLNKMKVIVGEDRTYFYLLTKLAELLVVNEEEGKVLKNAHSEIMGNKYLVNMICSLSPIEIKNLDYLSVDEMLAIDILKRKKIDYFNDYLTYFDSRTLESPDIANLIINSLHRIVLEDPSYRIKYRSNAFIRKVLNCEVDSQILDGLTDRDKNNTLQKLSYIEPNYVNRFPDMYEVSKYHNDMHLGMEEYLLSYASLSLDMILGSDKSKGYPKEIKKVLKMIDKYN